MTIDCVICGHKVGVDTGVVTGEIIDCDGCGVELEVTKREPLAVSLFEEEEK